MRRYSNNVWAMTGGIKSTEPLKEGFFFYLDNNNLDAPEGILAGGMKIHTHPNIGLETSLCPAISKFREFM